MGVVPATRIGKIDFYEAHLQAWATNAASIGLDPAAVLAFQTIVAEARTRHLDAEMKREASKAATQVFYGRTDAMGAVGSAMLRTIRAFADTTNDSDVYTLAQIPAPATPGPVGPPGQPYELHVGLAATGALQLKWKCDNPSGSQGTVYEVQRRIGSGPFQFVELAGERTLEDDTIPAGSSSMIYQIIAARGKTRGQAAQFIVNFGVGGVTASAVENTDIKLAA
jgi:hypothetical protein